MQPHFLLFLLRSSRTPLLPFAHIRNELLLASKIYAPLKINLCCICYARSNNRLDRTKEMLCSYSGVRLKLSRIIVMCCALER